MLWPSSLYIFRLGPSKSNNNCGWWRQEKLCFIKNKQTSQASFCKRVPSPCSEWVKTRLRWRDLVKLIQQVLRFLRPGSSWVCSKSWSRTFSNDPFIYGFTLPSSLSKASILQGFTERQSLHRHCRCFFWRDLTPLARGIRRKSKSHSDVEGFPHPCWFLIRVRDCWSLKAVLRIVWSSVRVNVCMYGGRSVEVRATSAERCLDAAFRCYWLAASRKEDLQPLRFGVRVAKWCLLRPLG